MLKQLKEKLTTGMGRDVVWTFAIQLLIMLCSFAITKLLASRLSIDDFGQYNVIKRSVQVLSFVMLAGVGITLPRYIPLYRKGHHQRPIVPLIEASFIYIAGVTLIVCAICWVFSSDMQRLVLGESGNKSLMTIALAYAFALAMAQLAFAYYRGVGDFKWYNGSQLAVQLAIILPLIILPSLTAANVFTSWLVITTVLVAFYFGRELWQKHGIALASAATLKSELKTILRYSAGRLIADFFQFSLAAFPLIYVATSLLATVFLLIFTDFLTRLLFAESYVAASDITRIMILSIPPQALYMLYRNPIDAVSVTPYNLIILFITIVAMIISFSLCTTLTQFAWAYLGVSVIQGLCSFITWERMKK